MVAVRACALVVNTGAAILTRDVTTGELGAGTVGGCCIVTVAAAHATCASQNVSSSNVV